ncbi:MAG: hypothetical protein WD069_20360 [Planctomycetales bacterium]
MSLTETAALDSPRPEMPHDRRDEFATFIAALELRPRCRELLETLDALFGPNEAAPVPAAAR